MAQVTFSSSVGGDGSTVSDDKNPTTGLDDGGHRTRFVPALSQVVAVAANTVASANAAATSALNAANAPNVSATSTTNLTIGIGNKTLTVQTGKAFVIGMSVKIAETITPTNWMHGTVTAYNSSTGSLTVSVDNISGISTATGWTISGSAPSFLGISEHLPISKPSLNLDFANSEQVDPRITFVRDTTATRFNELGLLELVEANEPRIDYDPVTGECLGLLVEEQRTNLLTYSEQFDNAAWTKRSGSTINANTLDTTDPYGTNLADKHTNTDTTLNGSYIRKTGVFTSDDTVYCASMFVKKGTGTTCGITLFSKLSSASSVVFTFNFDTEQVSIDNIGSVTDSVGGFYRLNNGWYRVWVASNMLSGTDPTGCQFTPSIWGIPSSIGSEYGYIFGAQLEVGSFPTSYIPSDVTFTGRSSTATYYGSDGLIKTAASGEARYNYNPTNLSVAPKLLIEPQRTNLLTYSEQFDNAAWTKTRASITANATTAPDGTLTADKLVEDGTAGNTHQISRTYSFTGGVTYTYSLFCKANTRTDVALAFGGVAFTSSRIRFNLSTGIATVETGSAIPSIESIGSWFKCSITLTASSTNTDTIYTYLHDSSSVNYNGDNISSIYIWGAQLEEGSYPTSYIPTTSATVTRVADSSTSVATTRNADLATMTGTNFSDWYRQDEGSVVIGSKLTGSSASQELLAISDGTNSNSLDLRWASGSQAQYTVSTSAVQIVSIAPAGYSSIDVLYNRAFVYKNDDFAQIINGVNTGTDTSGSVPTVNRMYIGNNYTGNGKYNGHIKNLSYYPVRLSNSELQALTS